MRTFAINTLGCKVNQYESQQIRELLEQLGLSRVETTEKPDLVVINTCCVTHTASAKSRQYIRKAQKLSPDAAIVVCGCLPTVQIGELNALDGDICFIRNREIIAVALSQIVDGQSIKHCLDLDSDLTTISWLPRLTSFDGHTRAFLKVQDGCDGYCSYCIVPKVRPVIYSKPPEIALCEAEALVEAGHKEIVVTGIFLGAYGQKSVRRKNWTNQRNDKLASLLDGMVRIPGLARIRLSSLEPADVTPRLLDTFCEHSNIMPHLHLSLQSGSDAVLKRMCRQYRADGFRDKVRLIKSRLEKPAMTTDIIVGFPGETDEDFEQTVELAREVSFAKIHTFSFSPRKGTAAAVMQDTVDNRVIKQRSKVLHDLDKQLQSNFRQQFIGETAEVLVENSNGQPRGRSERYFMVYLKKAEKRPVKNELLKVHLIENNEDGAVGQIR